MQNPRVRGPRSGPKNPDKPAETTSRKSRHENELRVCKYVCGYQAVKKTEIVIGLNINQKDLDPILDFLMSQKLIKSEEHASRKKRKSKPVFFATDDCKAAVKQITKQKEDDDPSSRFSIFNDF